MRVIMSAGGTGGHVYPALALARYLKEHEQAEIIFIGTNAKMEAAEVPKAGFAFHGLDARGFQGSIANRIACLVQVQKNIAAVRTIIKETKPDIVIGFGGYVTVPVMLAAKQCKIPTMIHEQNSVAGLANKTIAKFMDQIVISFLRSFRDFPASKTKLLGSPRASEAVQCKKDPTVYTQLGLKNGKPLLYIVMGSLGSESVNEKMIAVLNELNQHSDIQVVYVTGKEHYDVMRASLRNLKDHIKVVPYADQMQLLPYVDVICCRAGATTLAEITALGIPALVIPSPYVAHNHQVLNAEELGEHGAATIIQEKELTCQGIVDKLLTLCRNTAIREQMHHNSKALGYPEASQNIVALMKELINK